VVAKVEFHLGELFPRAGFIVTNLTASTQVLRIPQPQSLRHLRLRTLSC
jgi:hypothetical protein